MIVSMLIYSLLALKLLILQMGSQVMRFDTPGDIEYNYGVTLHLLNDKETKIY